MMAVALAKISSQEVLGSRIGGSKSVIDVGDGRETAV